MACMSSGVKSGSSPVPIMRREICKSRPHHRRLIADLDHLRQPVRDRGEPLQNVLLEAVL